MNAERPENDDEAGIVEQMDQLGRATLGGTPAPGSFETCWPEVALPAVSVVAVAVAGPCTPAGLRITI